MTRTHLYLLVLIMAVAATYSLGVSGPLVLDDGVNLEPILKLESRQIPWYAVMLTNPSGGGGRPVSMFSFLLNYWAFGFNPTAFKAANIFLHLSIGVALYALVRRLLFETTYSNVKDRVALVVTGLWLTSPFFVSTVLYVVQRMAMLATLFVVLALLSYLSFRKNLNAGQFSWWSIAAYIVCAILGVLSKENAVVLPLLVLVCELFFCRPITSERGRQFHKVVVWVLAVLPILAFVALVVFKSSELFDFTSRSFTLKERALTEARVLWGYVGSLLVPQSSQFGLFHDDIPLSTGLDTPKSTLLAIVAWFALIASIVWARKSSAWRPIAGGVTIFLAAHVLESTVFPLEIYFEHRNYLPGIGVYLALGLLAEFLIKVEVISLNTAKIIGVLYVAVCLVALSQRALIWSNYENIVYSSYEYHPNSPRSIVEAASQDAQHGKFDDAIKKLEYVRSYKMAPALGVNLQVIWTYCWFNRSGVEDDLRRLIDNVDLDSSTYTSVAMVQFNELVANKGCDKVPYAQIALRLANKLKTYYASSEYENMNVRQKTGMRALQVRVLEALNLSGQAQQTVDMVGLINGAGQGGIYPDILAAVALVHIGQLDDAKQLIDKLKMNQTMAAKMEAAHLASIEKMYAAKLAGGSANGDR